MGDHLKAGLEYQVARILLIACVAYIDLRCAVVAARLIDTLWGNTGVAAVIILSFGYFALMLRVNRLAWTVRSATVEARSTQCVPPFLMLGIVSVIVWAYSTHAKSDIFLYPMFVTIGVSVLTIVVGIVRGFAALAGAFQQRPSGQSTAVPSQPCTLPMLYLAAAVIWTFIALLCRKDPRMFVVFSVWGKFFLIQFLLSSWVTWASLFLYTRYRILHAR